MDADWFQSIVVHSIVFAKAAEFFQSANKMLYFCLLCVWHSIHRSTIVPLAIG